MSAHDTDLVDQSERGESIQQGPPDIVRRSLFLSFVEDVSDQPQSSTAYWHETLNDAIHVHEYRWGILSSLVKAMLVKALVVARLEGSELEVSGEEFGLRFYSVANPSPSMVARRFSRLLDDLPQVLGVGALPVGSHLQVLTVIQERDLDLWEEVFRRVGKLYDVFPDLQAEFIVVDREDAEAEMVLSGNHTGYVVEM